MNIRDLISEAVLCVPLGGRVAVPELIRECRAASERAANPSSRDFPGGGGRSRSGAGVETYGGDPASWRGCVSQSPRRWTLCGAKGTGRGEQP